jgi:CTP synthase (UTP-ammonia lyase)
MTELTTFPRPARIALVGDRSPRVQAHQRIPSILRWAAPDPDAVDPYWIPTAEVAAVPGLHTFDGIWLVPAGEPYLDQEGALLAADVARTAGVPFLGTCAGFQHAAMAYARATLGADPVTAESEPGHPDPVIAPLACALVGEEATVIVRAGTLAAELLGEGPRTERFFCRFGIPPVWGERLQSTGLVASGTAEDGTVRMLEIPGHPFFVGSLFQPELSSDRAWVHPLVRGFVAAALRAVATPAA